MPHAQEDCTKGVEVNSPSSSFWFQCSPCILPRTPIVSSLYLQLDSVTEDCYADPPMLLCMRCACEHGEGVRVRETEKKRREGGGRGEGEGGRGDVRQASLGLLPHGSQGVVQILSL